MNLERIANLFEYITVLIVFILLLALSAVVIFYINLTHYDALSAAIVPIALVFLGILIVYYDIKMREKAKQAILKKTITTKLPSA